MLKLTTLVTATTLLIGSVAAAQEADPNIDLNGDGFYSFPEISAVFPELTDVVYSAMDTTGDGLLDMAEVAAAQAAGVIPAG